MVAVISGVQMFFLFLMIIHNTPSTRSSPTRRLTAKDSILCCRTFTW